MLLTSNPTGQRLESVTDHKFMAKQTFRAWGKVENSWQKNYSGKKNNCRGFTICFVFHPGTSGLRTSFCALEIHHFSEKKSLVAMEIPSLHDESFLKVEDIGKTKCKLFWGFFNDVSDKSGWSRENSSPPKNHSWCHHLHVRNIK